MIGFNPEDYQKIYAKYFALDHLLIVQKLPRESAEYTYTGSLVVALSQYRHKYFEGCAVL